MTKIQIFEYVIFFVTCLAFSILINSLFIKFIRTLGIRNKEETVIRWSTQSKPAIGGISFYIIFLLSIIAYSFFVDRSQYFLNLQFIGVLFASTLGFLMGMFDDAYNTKPLIKLFTQISCGIILISTNIYIDIFDIQWLNYTITIFWVVGMMNSINMLDNMDAITSVISIFILITIIINLFLLNDFRNPDIFIILGILAALIGFLKFNWHPSTIYMGDTGSQFLGAFLAAIGIIYFWNHPDGNGVHIWSKQILTAVIIFSIPIIDTTTVVIKRLSKGKSPFVGGKDHTTHHISYLGFSDKQVAYIYSAISILSMTITVIAVNYINNWSYFHIAIYSLYFIILFVILFVIANRNIK
ncbi:MAG TPA: MraY family glycosyltransferase [Bacteroidales bacterium]|nr:MraY family glycosyltransferase [Bacteroidales bacterium]HPS17148.1 MraY family glycosyltransferase [Bacteroidales bacterium]